MFGVDGTFLAFGPGVDRKVRPEREARPQAPRTAFFVAQVALCMGMSAHRRSQAGRDIAARHPFVHRRAWPRERETVPDTSALS